MNLVFANYVLDTNRRELRLGADPVAVAPQVFDVLLYLVQNRNRLVSKEDLIASVWGGRIVSDSNVTSRINAARRAIGDTGEESCQYLQLSTSAPSGAVSRIRSTTHGKTICGYRNRE